MKEIIFKKCLMYSTICFFVGFIYLNVHFSYQLDKILLKLDLKLAERRLEYKLLRTDFLNRIKSDSRLVQPKCKCLNVSLKIQDNEDFYSIFSLNEEKKRFLYQIPKNIYLSNRPSCSEYHTLRHGPGQKIISYSLYGKNRKYYSNINIILDQIKNFYGSEWLMRIYHDESIDESIICEFECKFKDQIQFCSVNDLNEYEFKSYAGAYWRWLPLMDSFIDIVQSRDLDSWIIDREYQAVCEWFKSNMTFHLMRDHPFHYFPILAGLWSINSSRNRSLSDLIFEKLTDKTLIRPYNNKIYLEDQYFLIHHVWPIVESQSLSHDSYYCKDFGGQVRPFPTKRVNQKCFISCSNCCEQNNNFSTILSDKSVGRKCPLECRLKKEWLFC